MAGHQHHADSADPAAFPVARPRRLRRTPALRDLVAESHVAVTDLIAPLFVREGIDEPRQIVSLPGVVQHTRESLRKEVAELAGLGVRAVILFGIPAVKDDIGSGAFDPNGIVQLALADLTADVGDQMVVMADLCVDEYTSHGHCGVLDPDGYVDNDATLDIYAKAAVAQARAGAHVVAPSGMMDGQVGAIRTALDGDGHTDVAILAYSAKYASGLYGPFREAVDVTIVGGGDRKGYQQDWRNAREALVEVEADIAQGADIVMVKPALAYLDIIRAVRERVDVPVAAYHVSGEYSMIKAAAANGWIDHDTVALEHLTAIKRAGADIILTYLTRWFAERVYAFVIPFCDPDRCVAAGCTPTVCTGAGVPSNDVMFERASAVIPGGVNSSIRAFKSVGGRPYTVARAEGAHLWDVEGTRYIDLVQSYGAVILGHAHPAITAAVTAAVRDGTSYGAPTPREMKLAEVIAGGVPSCEQVRFMNSGTEATSTAVRLARGYTGRDRVVIFHGNFHGATDALLAAGGSGVATLGLPGTAGVPASAVAETLVVPYNVVPELDSDVAAVLVEPVAANMGVIGPEPGFLEGLRAECDRVGAVLVFDEVITGFRLGPGGAQAKYDVLPDLTTFGKVIGGGLPVGAVGGRRELMETLSPLGPVFHAGTLSGNPIATAAGLAALDQLTPDTYIELMARARHLAAVLRDACSSAGFAAQFPVVGTLVGMVCGDVPRPVDFAGAKRTDTAAYGRFFHAMLRNGVAMAPGAYEAIFVGVAHTDDVIDQIATAAHLAAAETSETSDLSA